MKKLFVSVPTKGRTVKDLSICRDEFVIVLED